jgi:hypothetical protein
VFTLIHLPDDGSFREELDYLIQVYLRRYLAGIKARLGIFRVLLDFWPVPDGPRNRLKATK